jgi:hypothetical protein
MEITRRRSRPRRAEPLIGVGYSRKRWARSAIELTGSVLPYTFAIYIIGGTQRVHRHRFR